jgi:protein TonB
MQKTNSRRWIIIPALLLVGASLAAQQADPFYVSLLEKAQKAFLTKNYGEAARDFEIAAFGLSGNKSLRAKALVYLSLSRYYLKDIRSSEKCLRDAAEIMGPDGFDGLQLHESTQADVQKLMAYYGIQEPKGKAAAADGEKPPPTPPEPVEPPAAKIKPETDPKEKSTPAHPLKPLNEIQEGDLVPLDMIDTPPSAVSRIPAIYPPFAKRLRLGGTVLVNALISEKGDVIKTEIIKGIKSAYGFDQESKKAVSRWKFNPASVKGIKVKVWLPVSIEFRVPE